MPPLDTLTDYSAVIRAQIERDVVKLKRALGVKLNSEGCLDNLSEVEAYIELGYLINHHHGLSLYSEQERIADLPVRISTVRPRTIRVCADEVRFVEEVEGYDEEGSPATEERTYEEDLAEETRW